MTAMLRLLCTRLRTPCMNVFKGLPPKCPHYKITLKQVYTENRLGLLRNAYTENTKIRCIHSSIGNEKIVRSSIRIFHSTECRNAIPPWFIFALRPLSKALAVFFGRYLRRRWKAASPEKRAQIVLKIKRYKNVLLGIGLLMTLGSSYFYVSHLEEDIITKRKKFIMFNKEQIMQLADMELQMQTEVHRTNFLPTSHPLYQRIASIVQRLLLANRDIAAIKEVDWRITIVDDPKITNAFVLPNGTIFIFTGILKACSNDDQLGIILAHEISHVLLSHMAEQISNAHLIDILMVVPLFLLWTILPDGAAFISHWLSTYITKLVIHLPFSRSLEFEADKVGLQLAAKACFDVREASIFWRKMQLITENTNETDLEWLSTHPSGETRQQYLDKIMSEAIAIREKAKCPHLPSRTLGQ